jgi:hypothetical protein
MIISELSNSHEIIMPAMVSCIASFQAVNSLYGFSAYETKLLRRGITIFRRKAVHFLQTIQMKPPRDKVLVGILKIEDVITSYTKVPSNK